jgi:hypothetical protein
LSDADPLAQKVRAAFGGNACRRIISSTARSFAGERVAASLAGGLCRAFQNFDDGEILAVLLSCRMTSSSDTRGWPSVDTHPCRPVADSFE